MSKNTRNRILLTAVAALLLVAVTVGGTLAWLTDVTPAVTNTFSPSDIHIDLTETMNAKSSTTLTENDIWTAQLIPGKEYSKDPKVSVDDALTNVNLWVFVKVEDTNASTYLNYSIANGWNQLTDADGNNVTGVYYREWNDNDSTDECYVLTGTTTNANGAVTVKSDLTADDLYNATASLKFTAYAIQKEGFTTAIAAWNEVSKITVATADNNLDDDDEGNAHLTYTGHDNYTIE